MSDGVRPHRRQSTRLPRPWDSPGKNTGVGCHCLLRRRDMTALIFIYQNFGIINWKTRDFPGGAMDRNSPARAGDVGSIPGPGRFRTPCNSGACGPQLESLCSATGETIAARSLRHNEEQSLLAAERRPVPSNEHPAQPLINKIM